MPASSYCPNVTTRVAVTIPAGHPLYHFLGTPYETELWRYLNLSSGQSGQACTIHTSTYVAPAVQEPVPPASPDAGVTQTVSQAQAMLATMDSASPQAIAIQNALSNVQTLLMSGSYTPEQMQEALNRLIMAMAGIY